MTVTTYDENKICSIALSDIAGGSIESITDPTSDLEAICANAYSITVESLLAHEWNWSSGEKQLAKDLDVTPLKDFDSAFRLPSDMLSGPSAVYGDGRRLNDGAWKVVGDHLYCSYQTVIIDYRKKPAVAIWPAFFVNLVISALKARLAIPVRESVTMSDHFHEEAFGPPIMQGRGGLFGIAKNLDAKAKPTPSLFRNGDPFTATRY